MKETKPKPTLLTELIANAKHSRLNVLAALVYYNLEHNKDYWSQYK